MQTMCEFLDRKMNHCIVVNNKDNIENDRCQFTGGSNSVTISNYCIDAYLLIMAKVLSNLIAQKFCFR